MGGRGLTEAQHDSGCGTPKVPPPNQPYKWHSVPGPADTPVATQGPPREAAVVGALLRGVVLDEASHADSVDPATALRQLQEVLLGPMADLAAGAGPLGRAATEQLLSAAAGHSGMDSGCSALCGAWQADASTSGVRTQLLICDVLWAWNAYLLLPCGASPGLPQSAWPLFCSWPNFRLVHPARVCIIYTPFRLR